MDDDDEDDGDNNELIETITGAEQQLVHFSDDDYDVADY